MFCKNKNIGGVMKFALFITAFVLQSLAFAGNPQQGAAVKTIVIDAGHGGHDPGAIGLNGKREANLALAVALKFGQLVEQNFSDVKVIYTRKTDKFLTLNERAEIANKAKADLFFCIHLNAAENREAFGSSTYVLGLHKTEDNLEVAKRENAVIELEGEDAVDKYEFNPNSPEGHIIMSMKQNAFLDQSIKIASCIENEFAERANRKSRGVKQAGFYVLYKTSMPSILAEIGFVSNPTEEKFLSSDEGQNTIADALFSAFKTYKNTIENNNNNEPVKSGKTEGSTIEKIETNTVQSNKPAIENKQNEPPILSTTLSTKPPVENTIKPAVVNTSNTIAGGLIFRLQLCASKTTPKNIKLIEANMGGVTTEDNGSGVLRYMSKDCATYKEALSLKTAAKKIGYPDAFVVGYKDGVRLSANETIKYQH